MAPTAETSIEIDAPLELVWSVMTDVGRYGEWNPFVAGIRPLDGELRAGAALELDVRWASGGATRTIEIVTRLEAPAADSDGKRRAAMAYRFTGWLARLALVNGSRLQLVEEAPGGKTIYRTSERFSGLFTAFVPLKKVQRGFESHAQALKARAEALRATGSAG